jgi:hypothetical protein
MHQQAVDADPEVQPMYIKEEIHSAGEKDCLLLKAE